MELKNNSYEISGVPVSDIVSQYGDPVYVYDSAKIVSQYKRLSSAFKDVNVKINYACKALTNINILKLVGGVGAGLDAVSINEIKLGLKADFDPKSILYTPNGVSFEEIEEAFALGVKVNIDNIATLKKIGKKYGGDQPIGIRINPHIMAGGNVKISTGHIDSKFGISVFQLDEVLEVVEQYGLIIDGVHMHTGSDILEIDAFLKAADILFKTAKNFPNLQYVDFGSGFKVPYKEGDIETDIEHLGTSLSEKFKSFAVEIDKDVQLKFEPGKFLVSEAGYFLVKVNLVKHTPTKVFAAINSGQNHLLRPMFYDAYHDIVNTSNPDGEKHIYDVVGFICETDTFAENRPINQIEEGHILAFKNAGAYCFSMASNYNSRVRPAEVLIHKGEAQLIRKREDFDDILRNQVEISL